MKHAKIIKRWMRERGMTQRQVARAAGISEAMVSLVLSGARSLGSRSIRGLAKAMGVSVEVFFQ